MLRGWRPVAAVAAVALLSSAATAAECDELKKRRARIQRKIESQCVTASPTPVPLPTGILCPDGFITALASKTDPWYGVTVDVPLGVTKRFCAPVRPPLVNGHPDQIAFTWYDVSDQDCGALNVRVDAPDPSVRVRGGEGYSASGQYVYYTQVGPKFTPEETTPGIYVITLVGGPSSDGCSRFKIAWRVR